MRIAVVTAHYLPEMGYVEVQLARGLAAEGHEVRVLTTPHIPPRGLKKGLPSYQPGTGNDGDVELERLPFRWGLNQVVIPKGLRKAVERFAPALVIAIGIGKLFTGPILLPPQKRAFRLVGLFGNNRFNYRHQKLVAFQKHLIQRFFKDPHYDRAARNCDLLWCYTPDTERILSEFTRGKREEELKSKIRRTTLGFDPERFYFDEEERSTKREEWGIGSDETVFVTATRIVPSKKLEDLIEAFEGSMERYSNLRYVLIGSDEALYSEHLKERMKKSEWSDHFMTLPFQRKEELRRAFNAADIGVWTAASITVQQGMGCGLPMLLPESPALSHLLQDTESGIPYRKGEIMAGLEAALKAFQGEVSEKRKERMMVNRDRFSDRIIARDLVERSCTPC